MSSPIQRDLGRALTSKEAQTNCLVVWFLKQFKTDKST